MGKSKDCKKSCGRGIIILKKLTKLIVIYVYLRWWKICFWFYLILMFFFIWNVQSNDCKVNGLSNKALLKKKEGICQVRLSLKMAGNSKSSLFHLIFRTRRRSISGEKRVVWIPIVGFEGGLFFNKIDEFLLAEKLFALTWKSALIVTSVGRGITLSVNVNRGHDSRYKSNRTLIQ